MRTSHPEIDWRRVVGLRSVVVHEYFAVDLDVVWVVVQKHLPQLKRVVRAMPEAGPQS
ncbi:HepT-like ribonuclease domain-containing protein [Oceanithermus sp.]